MQIEHKKNTAYYLSFPMVDSSTPASFKTGVSPADTAYYKDGAGAWTSLAITDTASEIGSTGVYEIDLSAAEMNHDQVMVKFSVAGTADTAFLFDMRTKLVDDLNDVSAADVNAQCDTAISDAALATAAALATVDTNVDAILVDTGTTLPSTLSGLATAAALATVDTNVDAILVDTGTTLPGTLATLATAAALTTVDANVDAILVDTGTTIPGTIATVDANVDAILVDTGTTLPASIATVDANVDAILADTGTDGVVISSTTANQLADALLNRDFSSVSDTNARTALNALRILRNKYSVSGATLTVTKEDDSTSAWTSTLTTDASANPITASDPA